MGQAYRMILGFPGPVRDARLRALVPVPNESERRARAAREEALRAEGARSLEPLARALSAAAERIDAAAAALERDAKPQIVELAKAIASEVLGREVEAGRYDLEAIVGDALKIARGAERGVVVRLHPKDHQAAVASGALATREGVPVKLAADPSLAPGSVRVETPYGDVARDLAVVVADVFAAVDGRR